MTIVNDSLSIETRGDSDMIDLTDRLALLLHKHKLKNGQMLVFVPGSTAGITTIEYEPGLKKDFTLLMERIIPRNARYFHEETWNDGNGHSHVRASLLGPSLTIPFGAGKLLLGTWQQVVLVDFDTRPRTRDLVIQFVGE
ncbi:MAG: secondary thiamine-phosphate synthase enzyme YjbQ [Bacteroidota bacterium]|jgi:secondary thiamine-phosphate synthase enzyme|nr:secondary thiamine-phosphate synthase enzyme YjbQ [Bacteroidota bacterium]